MNNVQYFSQNGQDEYLNEHIFNNKKNGIFIDVGAYDGVRCSNTYFFEKFRGWSGVCIEPHPDVYKSLEQNRKCFTKNCCVSDTVGEVDFTIIEGYSEMLSGITSSYDSRHLDRINRELRLYNNKRRYDIKVKTVTLTDILDEFNITNSIDYLSIDVEGSEINVLNGLDFNKYNIKYISVENNYNEDKFKTFLKDKGFILVTTLGADQIFRWVG